MRKKSRLKGVCLLLCAMFLCSSLPVQAEDEQIKISDKEYAVTLNDATALFLGNEKQVSNEVGSKVFLTYTVESVTKNTAAQSGFIGTMDNKAEYPYIDGKGRMYVESEEKGSRLFEQGYTYVFRFERTEDGFEYQAAKLKGDKAEKIVLKGYTAAPEEEIYKYYGIWVSGMGDQRVSAILNHVRCYDENGNDLGVTTNSSMGSRMDEMNALLDVHPVVDSSYSFSLKDTYSVAVSNKYPSKTDVLYMEYEVENITQDDTYQQGLIASCAPTAEYPHGVDKGLLQLKMYEKNAGETPLLREGGKYFICFQKKDDGFEGTVQCTVKGKTETFSFTDMAGAYDSSYSYFSFWLGENKDHCVTADFKNVKCYDADGNSLGIQINHSDVPLSHKGGIEDYSASQAVYYCKENNSLINLADEQTFSKEMDGVKEEGTYTIQNDSDLYLITEEGKVHMEYEHLQLKDEDENTYKRLKASTVRFVTGEETFEVKAEAATGFRVTEPEKPVKEGNTFRGWYLGDETAFNFDTIVTESLTLYAMWEDGDGNVYLAADEKAVADVSMLIAIAVSVVIAVGCAAGCTMIVRRRKHGSI